MEPPGAASPHGFTMNQVAAAGGPTQITAPLHRGPGHGKQALGGEVGDGGRAAATTEVGVAARWSEQASGLSEVVVGSARRGRDDGGDGRSGGMGQWAWWPRPVVRSTVEGSRDIGDGGRCGGRAVGMVAKAGGGAGGRVRRLANAHLATSSRPEDCRGGSSGAGKANLPKHDLRDLVTFA